MHRILPKSARAPRGSTCVRCRKMKLRCDAPQQFPAACSRCSRGKKNCQFGTSSPKPDDVQPIATRLGDDQGRPGPGPPSSDGGRGRRLSPNHSGHDDAHSDISARFTSCSINSVSQGLMDVRASFRAQKLGSIELSSVEALELLDIFFAEFHHRLPFLASKRTVLEECLHSPILFWAIAATALRSSTQHPGLLVRLVWPIRRLAAEESFKSTSLSAALSLVHALLLLCVWPLPYAALIDDPSWTFIGIAVQKGSQIGLNGARSIAWRGHSITDETARSLHSTWLVCTTLYNLLSFRFSTHNVLHVDSVTIERHLQGPGDLPPVVVAAACIAQKDMAISALLSHNSPMTLQVVRLFESDLDGLKKRFEQDWDLLLDNNLSGVKLRLYSMFLSKTSSNLRNGPGEQISPSQRGLTGEVATYVSKAYQTALGIINASLQSVKSAEVAQSPSTGLGTASETPLARLSHWTLIEFQYFIFATFILFDLSQKYQPSGDGAEAKTMVHQAWDLLHSCSVMEGDHYNRICDVIQYLVTRDRGKSESAGQVAPKEASTEEAQGIHIPMAALDRARARYAESWKRHPHSFPEVDAASTEASDLNGNETTTNSHGQSADWSFGAQAEPMAANFEVMDDFGQLNESALSELMGNWNFLPWDFLGTDSMDHSGYEYAPGNP